MRKDSAFLNDAEKLAAATALQYLSAQQDP